MTNKLSLQDIHDLISSIKQHKAGVDEDGNYWYDLISRKFLSSEEIKELEKNPTLVRTFCGTTISGTYYDEYK